MFNILVAFFYKKVYYKHDLFKGDIYEKKQV